MIGKEMKRMGYAKLKGRIVEKGYNTTSLAKELDISNVSLAHKLNKKADWRLSEVKKLCEILDISKEDMTAYFFTE